MKIVERQVGDVVILDLHGKILIGEGDDALRDAVTRLVDSGKTKILLNLGDVPYVDSAGLGALIGGIRRARELGGDVAVSCSRPTLTRLLRTTGFDRIVTVAETIEDAAAALLSSPSAQS